MEVYFDPDVLKQVAPEFQESLLQGLMECRYSPGSRGGIFANSENAKQSWLKEEEKIISISPNGNGRSHNDRLYAHYDKKTDRMYVVHYLTDHNTSNHGTMRRLIAKGPDAINYDIMKKINAHQAALDSGQNPEGLGFEDAKVHLSARQTAGIAKERLDLDDVFNSKPHLKEVCENLQGEFHNIKNQKDLDTLKEMCLDPKNDLLPKTESGKKILLQYAENDSEFKKFLENTYTEFEKKHPLTTDAELEARNKQSRQDKSNFVHTNKENITSKWKPINSNDLSKGYVATISQQYQARQMEDKLKTLDIECEYDPKTKSLRITDPEDIKKFEAFKGRLPDDPPDGPGGPAGPGGPDGGRGGGGGGGGGGAPAKNPDNNNTDKPNTLGSPKSKLAQNSWQDIDPENPSKGLQKTVSSETEARKLMGQYQREGIKCQYHEKANCIQITDRESITKFHELQRTGGASHNTGYSGNGLNKPRIPGQKVPDTPKRPNDVDTKRIKGLKALRKLR